ncbi:MAG TPA: hypothetical protein VF631_07735 [Allosphingosinicella sp.]|jgi:hypothetical protein|uniref:hypothetical protein n=1 Tax=Allosphingosinicella sp. TaxID=2823234 RepID=UPI002F2952D7
MHLPVDSGSPNERWRISYEDEESPDTYTFRAFATIGYHLWPAIVATGLGGNTYSRCILASKAILTFLHSKGYEAEILKVVCDVSRRRDGRFVIPNTVALGLPDADAGTNGLHVVVRMADRNGRKWIIDGSIRQADRPAYWEKPPEIIIARVIDSPPVMHPDDFYFQQGYHPLAAASTEQTDGSILLFQWVTKDDEADSWTGTPDAAEDRAEKLSKRLNSAWRRTPPPR